SMATSTSSSSVSQASSSGTGGKPEHFCDLPGSVKFTDAGVVTVPGAPSPTDLTFLQLPKGFCAHHYGRVGNARQIRFAPGGELFVASPTGATTSGGSLGKSAIMVLPDDNGDGIADQTITFMSNLPLTQGMLFANDRFYFQQDATKIASIPYAKGDRSPQP